MHGVLPLKGDWYAPAVAVEKLLRDRANRGVFRSFAAARVRGRLECSLVWLKERPMRVVFDPKRGTLVFKDLLPNLVLGSALYRDLKRFLRERSDAGLPEHRRVDPERLKVRSTNRKGSVSVALESLDGEWDYLITKGLRLVNEIFLGFLRGPYYGYMVENFQEPED